MKYDIIKPYADELLNIFKPFCDRIEIAGSIRRKQPDCKDIELVVIPSTWRLEGWFRNAKFTEGFWVTKEGPLMKQFKWKGKMVDLFICTPQNWGWIYFIRTGPKDWNIRAVNRLRKHNIISHEGKLRDITTRTIIETPEENDIFDLLKCGFIEPERRK